MSLFNSSLTCETGRDSNGYTLSLPRSACLASTVAATGEVRADKPVPETSAKSDAAKSSAALSLMCDESEVSTSTASYADMTSIDQTPDVALAASSVRHLIANKSSYVERVVEEIIETERTYVRDLGQIIQVKILN